MFSRSIPGSPFEKGYQDQLLAYLMDTGDRSWQSVSDWLFPLTAHEHVRYKKVYDDGNPNSAIVDRNDHIVAMNIVRVAAVYRHGDRISEVRRYLAMSDHERHEAAMECIRGDKAAMATFDEILYWSDPSDYG